MNKKSSIIRLIYPQWQGAEITSFMPDIPPEDASRGYVLGAELLKMLAPASSVPTIEVPVSMEYGERKIEDGVLDRTVIVNQTKVALDKLKEAAPGRIITLGGECSVSVVPFTYLADKYKNDVAVIWIDAHPDINLPGDGYSGYHAMALTACLGKGDKKIMDILPAKIDSSKTVLVGVRAYDPVSGTIVRQNELGVVGIRQDEVAENSDLLMKWLKSTGVEKVLIHFDLDVLDPAEIIAGVGTDPNGMKIAQVVRIINDVNAQYDIVGLTVAEPMPRVAIKLRNMMAQLPLFNE